MSELTTHLWHRFEPLARDLFDYGMGLETFTLWRCKITGIGHWEMGRTRGADPEVKKTWVGFISSKDAQAIRNGERIWSGGSRQFAGWRTP